MLSAIVVASIAALVSLASAIVTWKQNLRLKGIETRTQERLAVLNASTQALLESTKAEQERSKRAFEVAVAESAPIEAELSKMWALLQTVKDEIPNPKKIPMERHLEYTRRLAACVEQITSEFLDVYRSAGAGIPDEPKKAAHEAKSFLVAMRFDLYNILPKDGHPRWKLTEKDDLAFMRFHDILTAYQRQIALGRSELRMRQFEKYMYILSRLHGTTYTLPPADLDRAL